MRRSSLRYIFVVIAIAGFASTVYCLGTGSWTQQTAGKLAAGSGVNIDTTTYTGSVALLSSTVIDLAMNKIATASDYSVGYPPSNAVDGNSNDWYRSSLTLTNKWWQIDLGCCIPISGITCTVLCQNANYGPDPAVASESDLEISQDSMHWQIIQSSLTSVGGATQAYCSLSSTISCRYFRIYGHCQSSYDMFGLQVNNFIVYYTSGSYTSQIFNAGSNWCNWWTFNAYDTQPSSSSISYYIVTATSTYNLNTNASIPLTKGGAISSSVGPYLQIISSFSTTNPNAIPMIDSYTVTWANGYAITGWVTQPDSVTPISSVTVEAVGLSTHYTQTSSAGYYQMMVPSYSNWIVSVSSMPGIGTYTFNPANHSVNNLVSEQDGIDFVRNNTTPVLGWTGNPLAYLNAGLSPTVGASNTIFVFKVKYYDTENDSPKSGFPMVYILNGGTTVQLLSMSSTNASYIPLSGANYSVSTLLSPATAYSYYFTAQDEWGLRSGWHSDNYSNWAFGSRSSCSANFIYK